MDSSYRQEPLGADRVRFIVTPAAAPRSKGAANVIAVIFALVVIGTTPAHTNPILVVMRLAIGVVGAWYVRKWVNKWFAGKVDKLRAPGGTFVVSPGAIETAGATITREQLHRLIVRNGVPEMQGGAVAVDTGTIFTAMAAGAANDRAVNRTRAMLVSYMLCAESGGRSHTLAGGMNEVTAHGLLTDVSRILGTATA